MTPYYPARDGYPSMFEADGNAGAAVGGKPLHRSLVDRILANQFQCPVDQPALQFTRVVDRLRSWAGRMPARPDWVSSRIG
jgi:hypothetical protein